MYIFLSCKCNCVIRSTFAQQIYLLNFEEKKLFLYRFPWSNLNYISFLLQNSAFLCFSLEYIQIVFVVGYYEKYWTFDFAAAI